MRKTELSLSFPSKAEVARKSRVAKVLDEETQATLQAVKNKNSKAVTWFIVCWGVLFLLAVVGLINQNRLANENKQHIDCIIKLSETPLGPNYRAKYISNLNNTCQIKFTK